MAEGAREPPPGMAAPARRMVMLAVMLAIFMIATDSYIVATAMPTIVAELGGFRLFSWAFAAFLLAQAMTIPIYGRLADLYGRKRVFFFGAGVFLVGSILCGFAWGMVPLVGFRVLQGAGAGAILPIATTIVGDIYTPVERARMQGYISGVYGVAAVIGPTLGAFVVEHVSWSLVFWVNLPIGILTCALLSAYLHESAERRPHQIDYLGSLAMMFGVGLPMFALVQIGNLGMPTLALLIAAGAAALILFVRRERGAAEPMLPLQLWHNRVVLIGSLAGFTTGAVMMALSGFLPTYVQGVLGLSAAASGTALAASSVSWAFASAASGRLMIRTSYRLAAAVGGLCLLIGCALLIGLDPARGLGWACAGAFFLGTGMGFCNTAFIVSTQASVDYAERAMATSASMFTRIVGQSVGAAVFGAILNLGVYRQVPEAGDAINKLLEPAARATLGADLAARLAAAIAGSIHTIFILALLVAAASLALGLSLPARLSPTRPRLRQGARVG